jgi:threonine dehydrogenase-like Zn-dependent dehydrogenase
VETYRGRRAHAFEFFLEFAAQNRIDPAALLTHRFALRDYARAFETLIGKGASRAVKVAFEFA